ncbi:conserved hypothetical protein, partial [Trichinella spiralis]
ICENLMRKTLL